MRNRKRKWSVLTNPNNLSRIYGIKRSEREIRIIVEEKGRRTKDLGLWTRQMFGVLRRPVILFQLPRLILTGHTGHTHKGRDAPHINQMPTHWLRQCGWVLISI